MLPITRVQWMGTTVHIGFTGVCYLLQKMEQTKSISLSWRNLPWRRHWALQIMWGCSQLFFKLWHFSFWNDGLGAQWLLITEASPSKNFKRVIRKQNYKMSVGHFKLSDWKYCNCTKSVSAISFDHKLCLSLSNLNGGLAQDSLPDETKPLVKSFCEPAPKSLFWVPSCAPGFLMWAIIGPSQKLLFIWSVGLKWNLKCTTGNFQNKNLAAAWQLSLVSLHLQRCQGPKALILYSWCSKWKTVWLVHIFEKDATCKVSFSVKTLQTGVFLSLLLKSDVLVLWKSKYLFLNNNILRIY